MKLPDLALAPLPSKPPSVDDIQVLRADGPYRTKSDGQLRVRFVMNAVARSRFFHYDPLEIDRLPVSIEGLRHYDVRGLRKDFVGGGEFHRIRQEIVTVSDGAVEWTCQDLHGHTEVYRLNPKLGIWMPPFILHTYRVLEPDTVINVTANTIFFHPEDRADTRTHDTYSASEFETLKQSLATRST